MLALMVASLEFFESLWAHFDAYLIVEVLVIYYNKSTLIVRLRRSISEMSSALHICDRVGVGPLPQIIFKSSCGSLRGCMPLTHIRSPTDALLMLLCNETR